VCWEEVGSSFTPSAPTLLPLPEESVGRLEDAGKPTAAQKKPNKRSYFLSLTLWVRGSSHIFFPNNSII
jgi:hypothetical protein